jgi:dihydroflavonol-4-reductase
MSSEENKEVAGKVVCVTGASGFVASYIVKELLEKGYTVKGTVRSPETPEKYQYLLDLPNAKTNLTLVGGDLLVEGSFDSAVQDCDYVLHTASPYIVNVKDAQRELVDPAVNGTRFVLESCKKVPRIKKVVITSSCAAITDEPINGHVYTEEDWNEKSSLSRNPYYYSKVLAEKYAFEFLEKEKPHFDIATVNPFCVIGVELSGSKHLNESNEIIAGMFKGRYPAILDFAWGFVDVRDVATVHILVMENAEAKGRHIAYKQTEKMLAIVRKLKEWYPEKSLPSIRLDNWFGNPLVKAATLFEDAGTRNFAWTHLGNVPIMDNTKSTKLGFEYRDFWESLKWLIDWLVAEGKI